MTRDMHPPPPHPPSPAKVHTALVRKAAASIRIMSYYRDQYHTVLQSTPHDADWEGREYARRTKILDDERRGLAQTPYEDVRMYVTLMSSIVRQYSDSSLTHTRVRALHSAAATKVILRTVIPHLGSAQDRVLQDVKALLESTSSDKAFIDFSLVVLPGRNALTLLAQSGPTSDAWSGLSISVEYYKSAVAELESWSFPQNRGTASGNASTPAPIERERRPYGDSSSSNGIERQRRPYQGAGTGEFTDSEPNPSTRSNASAPAMSPSVSSESQLPEPKVAQQQYGSQNPQTSHLPRTRTRVPSSSTRAPISATQNPLPLPPQFLSEARNTNIPFQTQTAPPRLSEPRRPPPLPTHRRDQPELVEVLSPQIAEEMRQDPDMATRLPRSPHANVHEPQASRRPPSPAARPEELEPSLSRPSSEQLSAQRERTRDAPVSRQTNERAPPDLRTPISPSAPRPPSTTVPPQSQPLPASLDNPPPYSPRRQPATSVSPDFFVENDDPIIHQTPDSLATLFEDNPLSFIHTRDPENPISFIFTSESPMRWLIDALDIQISAPTYLPAGSATIIMDYPLGKMGELLQASDMVDGDIMMSCYRFSEDVMAWFRESQGKEYVQPGWGRGGEGRYWVWGIKYREGDVKVRVRRRLDVDEVRAWLGGSRLWMEG